ncbi:hypothetical protein D3C73_836530 [compost metagenome]
MKKSANFAQYQYLRIFDVFVKSVLKNAVISKSDIGGSLRIFLANEREKIGVKMVSKLVSQRGDVKHSAIGCMLSSMQPTPNDKNLSI